MRTINKMRAALVYNEYGSSECGNIVTEIIQRFLKNFPSYIETGVCLRKGCNSAKNECNYPLITINNQIFDNNFENLAEAISTNFPGSPQCTRCRHPLTNFERTFGASIFIEVRFQI